MSEPTLRGRKVLVSAGPTWVPIDAVRHLANFSSGRTGLTIAREAASRGARVVVLLGPGRAPAGAAERRALDVVDYVTFDDLHALVRSHVGSREYDAFIHTAAVADYRPVTEIREKLPSGQEELVLRLRPTPKIVDEVRALDPGILLVKFKLEAGRAPEELLAIARRSRERSDADLIVANDLATFTPELHPAYLLDRERVLAHTTTTAGLAARLADELEARFRARPPRAGASGGS